MTIERFDVIIVGAGLSGIGAARYLKTRLPDKSFVILETKPRMGGTWDLFRYPGIRSDSDMHTMGYAFKPWKRPKARIVYKGLMYSNVPNLIYFTGYFNASWTLKVDLVADFACRLLKHMDDTGAKQVVPRADDDVFAKPPRRMPFISGYIRRAAGRMPRQGAEFPWITESNYFWDRKTLLRGPVEDALDFSGPKPIVLPPLQRQVRPALQQAAE